MPPREIKKHEPVLNTGSCYGKRNQLVWLRFEELLASMKNDLKADHCHQPIGANVLFQFEDTSYSSKSFIKNDKADKIFLLIGSMRY